MTLLQSERVELVHRALVILLELVGSHGFDDDEMSKLQKKRDVATKLKLSKEVDKDKNMQAQMAQLLSAEVGQAIDDWVAAVQAREFAISHIVQADVVPAMQVVAKIGDPELVDLVKAILQSMMQRSTRQELDLFRL